MAFFVATILLARENVLTFRESEWRTRPVIRICWVCL